MIPRRGPDCGAEDIADHPEHGWSGLFGLA
jgi:hypothetical protein